MYVEWGPKVQVHQIVLSLSKSERRSLSVDENISIFKELAQTQCSSQDFFTERGRDWVIL